MSRKALFFMSNWTPEPQPFGANHVPLLTGLSSIDGKTPVPVATDPATGAVLTSSVGGGSTSSNITQFGGNNVVTGTGISGLGIPRVTVSSDSFPSVQPVSGTFFQVTQPTSEVTGLMPKIFDYISANLSGSTADVYTYKAGGSGGTTAATLTVNWTDSTKTVLSSVVRT